MDKPIIDLEELLEEAQDRIEEKNAIEGGTEYEW
ncbi:unknown [Clostridium sp. CAG:349]|nr:unknown [Clostridium sp. CAG:349]